MYLAQRFTTDNPRPGVSNRRNSELTVQDWFSEIEKGLEFRRTYACEDAWNRLEMLYGQRHPTQVSAGPNIVMSTYDGMAAALTVPFPYITVKPRKSMDLAKARIQETIDNALIHGLDMPDEVDRMIYNAFMFSAGIGKIGFDSEFGYDPAYDLGKIYGDDGKPMGMTSTNLNKKGQRIEFSKAQPGMPWFSSVSPHDFVVPWGTYDVDSAPWCAHRVVRHIDDVMGDAKYDTKNLKPIMSMEDFVRSYESIPRAYRMGHYVDGYGLTPHDCEYVELWEIHDRRTQKVIVIATGHDKFLRHEPDVLQFDGKLPFVRLGFVPRSRWFWTTPDALYLENVQLELSDIALQGQKHRRSRVLKLLGRQGAIDDAELDKLLSANVGAYAEVKAIAGDRPLSDVVTALNIPADIGLMQEAEFTQRNARQMIGMSANQVGEFDVSGRRSATEAAIVSKASTIRMDRRQAQIAKLYKKIFERIHPIIWSYWTTPKVQEILGPDGAANYVPFVGEQLEAEYQVATGFSTDPPESLQQRRQAALQTYMVLRQDPMINPIGLARMLNFSMNDPEFSGVFQNGILQGSPQAQAAVASGGLQMGGGQSGSASSGSGGQAGGQQP